MYFAHKYQIMYFALNTKYRTLTQEKYNILDINTEILNYVFWQ